jgi:hypothetical protein
LKMVIFHSYVSLLEGIMVIQKPAVSSYSYHGSSYHGSC